MKDKHKELLLLTVDYLLNGLAAAVIFAVLALAFLALSGIKPYVVKSGSMEPQVKTGSLCFIQTNALFDEVNVGDVIAFETAGGMLVTHRAVRLAEGKIETKGDVNDVSDGLTTDRDNFRGITLFSIPYLGYLCVWTAGHRVEILCILFVFGAFEIINKRKML